MVRSFLSIVNRYCVQILRIARGAERTGEVAGRDRLCTFTHGETQSMSTTMTIRLEDEVRDRLDQLAEATQRSKSFLAAEAIRAFVETNEWQIGEIRAALREADAGDFASDKDVAALSRKWKVNAG